MSYYEKLREEIYAKLDELEADGQELHAAWITHAVCNDHVEGLADNDHAEFWQHGGYHTVRNEVRLCINDRHGDKRKPRARDPWLPGFVHLQPYYSVNRGGDEIGVPAFDLGDEEIDERAALYRKFGDANHEHADELIRFKHWRRKQRRSA
jgi:hypothetical protein